MKHLSFIIAVMFCINLQAQIRKVSTSPLQDTIVLNQGAMEIEPVIVNAQGDTARSLNWYAFDVHREDTTAGCNTLVQLYDKKGNNIANFNQPIPASVVNIWGINPAPVDDYIFAMNPRFKRILAVK